MEREDRRVRKTRAQLRGALTQLMEEKPLREITVKELAQRADVNRGTFYAHYQDIPDMVERVEQEVFQEFSQVMDAYGPEELGRDLTPILTDVFQFVKKNDRICGAILSSPALKEGFFLRLSALIYEKCLREWGGAYALGEMKRPNDCLEFVVSGTVGLVRAWALRGFAEPEEEMAALAGRLIRSGLRSLPTEA